MIVRIIILIIFTQSVVQLTAQEYDLYESRKTRLTDCKKELADLSTKNIPIKSVSINDEGEWVIIFGDFGFSYSHLPAKMQTQLTEFNSKEVAIYEACLWERGDWAILAKQQAMVSVHSKELYTSYRKIKKGHKNIRQISQNKSGSWLILYGGNGATFQKMPHKAQEHVVKIKSQQQKIRQIVLGEKGAWLILFAEKGLIHNNIPTDLAETLRQLIMKEATINYICISLHNWVVVFDESNFLTNF